MTTAVKEVYGNFNSWLPVWISQFCGYVSNQSIYMEILFEGNVIQKSKYSQKFYQQFFQIAKLFS